MAEILNQIQMFVTNVINALGYPGIALIMLLENLIPPIPSEAVMPFAGFLISSGEMTFIGVLAAGTLGAVAGATTIYYVGVLVGQDRLARWIKKYGRFLLVTEEDLERSLRAFGRYGSIAILIGRLIPGVRSAISIPAGICRMKLGPFLLLTLIGTVLWNTFLITAGFLLGENWRGILEVVDAFENLILFVAALLLLFFIFSRIRD